MCVCDGGWEVHVYLSMYMLWYVWRGQRTTMESSLLPPLCGSGNEFRSLGFVESAFPTKLPLALKHTPANMQYSFPFVATAGEPRP